MRPVGEVLLAEVVEIVLEGVGQLAPALAAEPGELGLLVFDAMTTICSIPSSRPPAPV